MMRKRRAVDEDRITESPHEFAQYPHLCENTDMRFGAHRQLIRRFRAKQAARGAGTVKTAGPKGSEASGPPATPTSVSKTTPVDSDPAPQSASADASASSATDRAASDPAVSDPIVSDRRSGRRPLQEVALDAGTAVGGRAPGASVFAGAPKASTSEMKAKSSASQGSASQDTVRRNGGSPFATMSARVKRAIRVLIPARAGDLWRTHHHKLSEAGAVLLRGVFFAAWFTPAVFFVAIGICTLIAPELVATAVAAFFVFLGLGFFVLAIKFIQFKRKVERVARSFEARLVVQGIPIEKIADMQERRQGKSSENGERLTEIRIPGSQKKILFH